MRYYFVGILVFWSSLVQAYPRIIVSPVSESDRGLLQVPREGPPCRKGWRGACQTKARPGQYVTQGEKVGGECLLPRVTIELRGKGGRQGQVRVNRRCVVRVVGERRVRHRTSTPRVLPSPLVAQEWTPAVPGDDGETIFEPLVHAHPGFAEVRLRRVRALSSRRVDGRRIFITRASAQATYVDVWATSMQTPLIFFIPPTGYGNFSEVRSNSWFQVVDQSVGQLSAALPYMLGNTTLGQFVNYAGDRRHWLLADLLARPNSYGTGRCATVGTLPVNTVFRCEQSFQTLQEIWLGS